MLLGGTSRSFQGIAWFPSRDYPSWCLAHFAFISEGFDPLYPKSGPDTRAWQLSDVTPWHRDPATQGICATCPPMNAEGGQGQGKYRGVCRSRVAELGIPFLAPHIRSYPYLGCCLMREWRRYIPHRRTLYIEVSQHGLRGFSENSQNRQAWIVVGVMDTTYYSRNSSLAIGLQ